MLVSCRLYKHGYFQDHCHFVSVINNNLVNHCLVFVWYQSTHIIQSIGGHCFLLDYNLVAAVKPYAIDSYYHQPQSFCHSAKSLRD